MTPWQSKRLPPLQQLPSGTEFYAGKGLTPSRLQVVKTSLFTLMVLLQTRLVVLIPLRSQPLLLQPSTAPPAETL